MSSNNDDSNRAQYQVTTQSQGGFSNWVKNHKLMTAVIVLLLVGLLYWLFTRNKSKQTDVKITSSPGNVTLSNSKGLNITKRNSGQLF